MSRIEKALEKAAEMRDGQKVAAPSRIDRSLEKTVEGKGEASSAEGGAGYEGPSAPIPDLQIDHPLVVTYSDPRSPIAEEFRKLKSTLVNMVRHGEVKKTLMITSSLSGEGKSVTAINLAISLAQEYDSTVLLVDADLRKPSIHKYFHLTPRIGLSDCLCDGLDIGQALIKTGIGKLTILPAGREVENPAELLGAQRMKTLVQEMRHRYPDRFIILDTPPVLPVAETRSIAAYVDGVIFVVREGVVTRTHVEDALAAIQHTKIVGLVYNNIENESLKGRYHYYYHGY